MIWFASFQIAGLIFIICAIFAYCKFKNIPYFFFFWTKKKGIFFTILLMIVLIALACIKPLYNTFDCYTYGLTTKTTTKYSWWFSKCLAKNKSGAFVQINLSRSVPDGGQDSNHIKEEDDENAGGL